MRESALAGLMRGLVVGLRVAIIGVIAALLFRFLTTTLDDYVQGIMLTYWGLAPASLALFWWLTRNERKNAPTLYDTQSKRLSQMIPMILVAVILGTVLFIGYATNVRFAPAMVGDQITQLYRILLDRVAGLPFIINVVVGLVGAAALAMREPQA